MLVHSHRKRWLGRVSRFGSFVPKRGTIATRIARDRDLDRYIWRSQTTSIGVPKSIRSTYQNGSVQRTKVKRYGVPKWSGTFFDSVVRRKEMGDAFSKGNNMGAVYFCFGRKKTWLRNVGLCMRMFRVMYLCVVEVYLQLFDGLVYYWASKQSFIGLFGYTKIWINNGLCGTQVWLVYRLLNIIIKLIKFCKYVYKIYKYLLKLIYV